MPLLKLQTSVEIPENEKEPLIKACSKCLSEATGKPETYVMVLLESATGSLGGKVGPVAFVDVRGIGGLDKDTNGRISADICGLLEKQLGIAPDRTYLTFTDVPATNWGWNGATFG